MLIKRQRLLHKIETALARIPVTALLGPRQCGKTTLAHMVGKKRRSYTYFDLENPLDIAQLENPMSSLERLKGLVIIDEIQRMSGLFKVLRVLSDRRPLPARFLILGSASFDLIKKSSESLAGRIEFVDMEGFSISEAGLDKSERLWFRGGFPNAFLARNERDAESWRENFIRTFLERDIPQLGVRIPALTLRRFWTMVAHYHGQIWNGSEIGASLGIAHTTTRQYLDILTGAFVVRQLPPWFENIGKRLVKSPKIYVRDSGIFHSLLRIPNLKNLETHPKLGASWEGFVLEQILIETGDRDAYFWATHAGAELDLVLIRNGKRWGFEFKLSDAPSITKSIRIAMDDLDLKHLWIIYNGKKSYTLDKKIDCIGLKELSSVLTRAI